MAITATYTVTLSASDKDHARGEYVYASIICGYQTRGWFFCLHDSGGFWNELP